MLQAGDRLEVTGPFGVFTLRDGRDSDLVFVGGGAGMAPILSVLRSLAERGIRARRRYSTAPRRRRDLCFEQELRALEEKLPNFRYVPALSEPGADDDDWDGEVGLITDVVKRHEATWPGPTATSAGRRRWWRRRWRCSTSWASPRSASTTTSSPPRVEPQGKT